ncbi:cleft lip and palate transmembrane 1 [Aulographum hederae CBS 113979]|uniref:Cleft lip and palate transmembrane 1 n=1 Tax=Aulographum hederae CBS 113979 TaxID=1176131 RepID=A0A6G1HAQ3_9PEZI|nr:cleft lip and palate transmembrane 1 [Aulographum hederae CBS 113979]
MPEQAAAKKEEDAKPAFLRTALQSVGIFLLMQFALKQFMGTGTAKDAAGATTPAGSAVPDFSDRPADSNSGVSYAAVPQNIAPIWSTGTPLDLRIYVSPSLVMPALKSMPASSLIVDEKEFGFGDWSDTRVVDTTIDVPTEVQNGGTLWAHFLVAQSGNELDPTATNYDQGKAYHFYRPLTQNLALKKKAKTRNLLAGGEEVEEEEDVVVADPKSPTWSTYYHPNFTMSFVPDSGNQVYNRMHPAVRQFVQLERSGARDESGQNGWYYPILYVNTFWQLRSHMTELNSTVKILPLHIDLNNMANWKFSIFASVDEGMKETAHKAAMGEAGASGDGSEMEELKRILLDSNSYLLATTFVVSIFHMIFEMLAFKNDVSHWRKKKDNVGTSVRTIMANVVMQLIIFLYLMDNNENTSWMILFGQGMGIAIEAWKITKAVNVRVRPNPEGSLIPYSVKFEDKHQLSETEKQTQEYDEIAFKYLYLVAIPLLLAYAAYSLMYQSHKSWYSFIIATLVGSVYAYGFLMMVPSLYINYRLKSVAHMPAKAMTYKFLNTFIDDLFAFTIKMPLLHRLATLRDDIIFFVYLYQSYKYKVDFTRVNEFGQGGDDEEVEEKLANKPLTAPADADAEVKEGVEGLKEADAKATGMVKGQGRKRK